MPTERTAVVTGVSSGIGHAIADRLQSDGWHVVGLSRTEPELPITWYPCDLAGSFELPPVAAVDALVHAAGFQVSGRLGDLDPDDGARMYAVHVDAAVRLAAGLVDRLIDGGRIVLIGSRTATGVAGKSQYAATKAALRALARSWAAELAPRRITANVVEPGPTDTAMLTDPARAATPPITPPLGRLIRPDEIAALTAYLLSPDAAMLTGQHLTICAGASL
ncbi:SDR family NAD(P)-dependent oxidoreductase [Kribbella sp. GL6]|uniref:SDR family NAD(P)-dependent oxidoreductase n=1 Tax=Kribbella sp. GL6 TaxID=3419765 RepID=UPI003D048FDE